MAQVTPIEQLRRERIESVLVLAAPALDLVLAVGERISRVAGSDDEYYPIRAPGEAFELPTASTERRAD